MSKPKTEPKLYRIDSTAASAVVVCARCTWRGAATSKRGAYRLVADHLRRAHDDHRNAWFAAQHGARHDGDVSQRAVTGPKVSA